MDPKCDNGSMPRHCAEKFGEISRSLGQLDRMGADLKLLREAVVGNGRPYGSVIFRLKQLETAHLDSKSTRRRWSDRAWKLIVAATLVVLGWLLNPN